MDMFGIGNAIKAAVNICSISSRVTGRTTALVESLKDGDRVIFTNQNEAKRVQRLVKERGIEIETRIVDPRRNPIGELGTGQGRTVFDHSWVEDFYRLNIERLAEHIDNFELNLSGETYKHRETRRNAEERDRWMQYLP